METESRLVAARVVEVEEMGEGLVKFFFGFPNLCPPNHK